jgi:hypothetical protein
MKTFPRYLIAGLLVCASLASAEAAILRSSEGRKADFDGSVIEHNGTITDVSTPSFANSNAIRCRQIYDANYNGRYHSSTAWYGAGTPGSDRWYSFAVFLPPSSASTDLADYGIFQTISNFGGTALNKPFLFLSYSPNDNRLNVSKYTGNVETNRVRTDFSLTGMVRNAWNTVVIQHKVRDGSAGLIKVWINGTEKLNHSGANTYTGVTAGYRIEIMTYATTWYNVGATSGHTTRDFFFDKIKLGDGASTYAQMLPVP